MKMIDRLQGCKSDDRTRKMLLPEKIITVKGKVIQAQSLLTEKPLQIGLNEITTMILQNEQEGEHAGILLDFGMELHGTLRILNAESTPNLFPEVRICLGESVSEAMSHIGEKYACNDHSDRDVTVILPGLSDNEYLQSGFRFAYVELLSEDCEIHIKSIVAVCIYRELPYLGSFVCNDNKINQIYDTAVYTAHLNMQGMLWDGIKRDRLVWIGDMHPEMLTIRTVFGNQPLIEESLQFVMDQTRVDEWMNGIPTYSMWWLIILADWYQYTGDNQFINKNGTYIIALLNRLIDLVAEDGTDSLPSYFLDWPTVDQAVVKDGVRGVMAIALKKGAVLSRMLCDEACAIQCEVKQQLLIAQEVKHDNAKQIVALCMLAGSMNREEAEPVLIEGGAKGMSTFMSYYILKSISLSGQIKTALEMMKEYYGAMLDLGATTFWEDFNMEWLKDCGRIDELPEEGKTDIHGDNGAYCYKGFRHSLCHGWASGPVPFLNEKVLGIEIIEPGCKKIALHPDLGQLEWAIGTFPTPYGILTVDVRRDVDGNIKTVYDAPKQVDVILV